MNIKLPVLIIFCLGCKPSFMWGMLISWMEGANKNPDRGNTCSSWRKWCYRFGWNRIWKNWSFCSTSVANINRKSTEIVCTCTNTNKVWNKYEDDKCNMKVCLNWMFVKRYCCLITYCIQYYSECILKTHQLCFIMVFSYECFWYFYYFCHHPLF